MQIKLIMFIHKLRSAKLTVVRKILFKAIFIESNLDTTIQSEV